MQEFDKNEGEPASAAQRMKDDWNARALENAKWYINTVGVTQSDEEFFGTGEQEVLKWWPQVAESIFSKCPQLCFDFVCDESLQRCAGCSGLWPATTDDLLDSGSAVAPSSVR